MPRFASSYLADSPMPAVLLALAIVLCMLLSGCRPRDGDGDRLVVPELVRTHVYVAPHGDDSDPGTRSEPLRTLARAAQVVSAGTTVHVAPGFYAGGVRSVAHGTPEARIVFQSSERWGARIVPPLAARQAAAWDNRGDYVDIVGFDIDGAPYQSGMRWRTGIYAGGRHDGVHDNRVHHIATDGPCEADGGAGIAIDSQYKGNDAVVSGNTVHDIGAAECHDMHGITVGARATVRNNVVYRVPGAAIHLWQDAHHVAVQANTVVASGIGILVGADGQRPGASPTDHSRIDSNIVYDNGQGIVEQGASGAHNRFNNNLVHANAEGDWQLSAGRRHTGTIDAPPQFADYARGAAMPDLRLRPGSPALGQSVSSSPEPPGEHPPGSPPIVRRTAIGAQPPAPPRPPPDA